LVVAPPRDRKEVVMLGFYIDSEFKQFQLRQCPVSAHLDGLCEWLRSARYKRRPGQLRLRGAAHFGYWVAARGVRTGEIDDGMLAAFAQHLSGCRCAHPFRGRDRYHQEGAQQLFAYLQRIGVVPTSTTTPQTMPRLVEQFSAWLRQHRGVRESTLGNYVPLVQEFLAAQGDDPVQYDAAKVRAFILAQADRSGRSRIKSVVNTIRMFLRFLAVAGTCPADLAASVPRIAQWKLAALPRYLVAADVERVVSACAPTTTAGARDRAVILLLARLGLRAGDVRNLRLGDIDWARGRLRVMGKGRCETWLPLPQEPGDAMLQYLTRYRPAIDDDHMFLRVHAPIGPLPSSAPVSKLVRRALQRAQITAPSLGAHVLRHSAATTLLRNGVALDAIGAVLRHRCVESTAHYAKVDVTRLRAVAQPWPPIGGASC
jgi:integrase/recombinase XerD